MGGFPLSFTVFLIISLHKSYGGPEGAPATQAPSLDPNGTILSNDSVPMANSIVTMAPAVANQTMISPNPVMTTTVGPESTYSPDLNQHFRGDLFPNPHFGKHSGPYGMKSGGSHSMKSGGSYGMKTGGSYGMKSGGSYGMKSGGPYGMKSEGHYGMKSGGPYGMKSKSPYGMKSEGHYGMKSGGPFGMKSGMKSGGHYGMKSGMKSGGPYGMKSESPYGMKSGGPYGMKSEGPYGMKSGGPYGMKSESPYGTKSGGPYGMKSGGPYGMKSEGHYGMKSESPYRMKSGGHNGKKDGNYSDGPSGSKSDSQKNGILNIKSLDHPSIESTSNQSTNSIRRPKIIMGKLQKIEPKKSNRSGSVRHSNPNEKCEYRLAKCLLALRESRIHEIRFGISRICTCGYCGVMSCSDIHQK